MDTTNATKMHTVCFVSRKNETIFDRPNSNTVDSQLQLSFSVPHVFSLTRNVMVVNIEIAMYSIRQLIQDAIDLE